MLHSVQLLLLIDCGEVDEMLTLVTVHVVVQNALHSFSSQFKGKFFVIIVFIVYKAWPGEGQDQMVYTCMPDFKACKHFHNVTV